MSFRKNIFLVIVACILIQGCTIQRLSQSQADQYKHIGVISGFGDDFMISKQGATVFGNDHQTRKNDVGADSAFTAAIIANLSGTYDAVDLSRYSKDFADAIKTVNDHKPSVGEAVKRVVPPGSYDAYVVITPDLARVVGTYESVKGVGIIEQQTMLGDETCFLHAAYMISVVDGKDYSVVAKMVAFPLSKDKGLFVTDRPPVGAPAVKIDCQFWQSPDQSMPAINQQVENLAILAVPETLKDERLLH